MPSSSPPPATRAPPRFWPARRGGWPRRWPPPSTSSTTCGTLGCFGGIWNDDDYRRLFATALGDLVADPPEIVHPGDVAMAGALRVVLRHHGSHDPVGTVPEPGEDAAVAAFTDALIAAKAAE